MKLSILHISDLHRDPANPIGNAALLNSLEHDHRRYVQEEVPAIRPPDLIIASGDIVQGIQPGVPEEVLQQQYAQALTFLDELAQRFLAGDRSRVIIIPGNHDVSAYHFYRCLQRIEIVPDRKKALFAQLFSRNSPLRWSWPDFELHEIIDRNAYEQRFAAFAEFYSSFYGGTRTYSLNPAEQFDLFDYAELELTIAGFSSCYNNDLYNRQGEIHPDCIASAGDRLRERRYDNRLRLAVWHHNTEGLPLQADYMDPDIIQNLIDDGFSLGFHGHQHRPQFLDIRFRYQGTRRMTVLSAGTLCGGPSPRFGRAYNIVELDTETATGVLHIREMLNDDLLSPIWGRCSLPPHATGHVDFTFDRPPEPLVRVSTTTAKLIAAQQLYESKEYRKAADALVNYAAADDLARRLYLGCLTELRDHSAIGAHFDPPLSAGEAIALIDALWNDGQRDRLRTLLQVPLITDTADLSLIEIRDKYAARLRT